MKTIVKSLSEDHIDRIKEGNKKRDNSFYRDYMTKLNISRRIKLLDTVTGEIFDCERAARARYGVHLEYHYRKCGRLIRYHEEITDNKPSE